MSSFASRTVRDARCFSMLNKPHVYLNLRFLSCSEFHDQETQRERYRKPVDCEFHSIVDVLSNDLAPNLATTWSRGGHNALLRLLRYHVTI